MRATTSMSLVKGCVLLTVLGFAGQVSAGAIGPVEYLQRSDSPIAGGDFVYFHLEDFEDSALDTPGVTASSFCITPTDCFSPTFTDSVDGDDGAIDGFGTGGHSLWAGGSVTFTFDAAVLGELPNAVGIVWTDGGDPIRFEAFDENGASLGIIEGHHAN